MFRRTDIATACAGVALCLAAGPSSRAVEYVLQPGVDQRFSYDDNMLLQQDLEIESGGYLLTPRLKFDARSDDWNFNANARMVLRRFEEDVFDSDDQFVSFGLSKFTQKRQFQLFGRVDRETFRTAQLQFTGDPGIGRVVASSLRPVTFWQLTERLSLTAGVSFDQVNYDDLNFDDYQNISLDLGLTRSLTERMSLEVSAFASDFDASPVIFTSLAGSCRGTTFSIGTSPQTLIGAQVTGRSSRTYGFEVGLRRAVNESLQWSVAVGGRDVENTQDIDTCIGNRISFFEVELEPGSSSTSDTDNGFTGRTTVSYTGEKTTAEVTFSQSVSPAALGFLIDSRTLQGRVTYRFAETLTAAVQYLASDAESVSDTDPFEREFSNLTGTLNWRVSPKWQIVFGARYRTQERLAALQSQGGVLRLNDAQASQVFVDFKFNADPFSVSR